MPRSFLVKRRKSEDAKPVSDLADGTKKDGLNHEAEQQTIVPSNQHVGFCPSPHLNLLERNHAFWNHSNNSCFHYRTGVLQHHTTDNYVNLAPNCVRVKHCCCSCFNRKFEGDTGCFCCLPSAAKILPDVTHRLASPWCSDTNFDCPCHVIYFPKHEPFHPKFLPTPLKRTEFKDKEVGQREEKGPMSRVDKDVGRVFVRSDTDLKVLQKEKVPIHKTTEKEDTDGSMDEIPAKKIKMSITDIVDTKERNGSGKISTVQKTTQLDTIEVKKTNDNETEKTPASCEQIKNEFSELQNAKTNNSELCNGEVNSHTKPMNVQQNLPRKATRKLQHSKSKKAGKDSIVKPYNTRVTTSRPRVYSSDFVGPEEEDDWRQDKEEYQMKGRQRSKLNRLLANEHERRRVAQLNNAYQDLRQLIPGYQCDTKLPKIKILKYAINYIAHLDDILGAGSIQEV